MTTDYKNLTGFDAAAIVMIAVGLALIAFQVFVSLPENTQVSLVDSFQILDLNQTVQDAADTVAVVNEFGVQNMVAFYDEFYGATEQVVFEPIKQNMKIAAAQYNAIAQGVMQLSDYVAQNYQSNYVTPGVEGDVGGKVMGAYFDKLLQ